MIDHNDFWVPPGCLPGKTEEQTREYLRELEQTQRDRSKSAFGDALIALQRERIYATRHGVARPKSRPGRAEFGVRLPSLLRETLGWQNGGYVRNTGIEINDLSTIVPVDDDFWQFEEISEKDAANHSLVFVFGSDHQVGATTAP